MAGDGPQKLEYNLFAEDLVCAADDPSRIGLISEVYGQVEEDEDYPYEDGEDKLEQGEVRVCWKSGEEEAEDARDLKVLDRALMHGDIVGWSHSPLGQTGHVIDVELAVDLETADGTICSDIPSTALKHIRSLRAGHYVVHGVWLGRVQGLTDAVHVQFDDGSLCRIAHATVDTLHIKDETDDIFMGEDQSPFYPGQRVRAASAFILHHSQWLRGSFKGKRDGIVVHVEIGMVDVEWIAACKYSEAENQDPPDDPIAPHELHVLARYDHTCWQLGDRALLRDGLAIGQILNWGKEQSSGDGHPLATAPPHQGSGGNFAGPSGPGAEASNITIGELVSMANSSSTARGRAHEPFLPERSPASGGTSRSSSAATGSRGRRRRNQQAAKKVFDRRVVAVPDVVKVVKTCTKVDVQWQDGQVDRGIEAFRLSPLSHFASEHELWPEEFVEEVVEEDDGNGAEAAEAHQRIGLVRSVDAKARLATVTWLKRKDEVGVVEPPTEDCLTEKVSVYQVREHADYQYRIGDIVLRLSPAEIQQRGRVGRPIPEGPSVPEQLGTPELIDTAAEVAASEAAAGQPSAKVMSADTEETLAWVGEVVRVKDGLIDVAWASGARSSVTPDKIYVVSRDDDEEDDGDSFMSSSESGSWETMGDEQDRVANLEDFDDATRQAELRWGMEERMSAEARYLQRGSESQNSEDNEAAVHNPAGPSEPPGGSEDSPVLPGDATNGNLSPPAMDGGTRPTDTLLANIAKAWAGPSGLGQMLNNFLQMDGATAAAQATAQSPAQESAGTSAAATIRDINAREVAKSADTEPADHSASGASANIASGSMDIDFDRYGEVDSCSDHIFRDEPLQPVNAQQWQKRVLKEMKTLSRNLPGTIWVRSYSGQLGLLRAAILGAKGTPYHDNLFFFDIYLPPTYPDAPPELKYHSHGRRLNPNLYENGKVLVSIQGLVLVPKPYFNEAGYEKQTGTTEGEHNASLYNENAFLLSCRAMLDSIRLPPEHFAPLVQQHFKQAAPTILSKIEEYLTGRAVGPAAASTADDLEEFEMPSSEGFRLLLGKLKPKVAAALESLNNK